MIYKMAIIVKIYHFSSALDISFFQAMVPYYSSKYTNSNSFPILFNSPEPAAFALVEEKVDISFPFGVYVIGVPLFHFVDAPVACE